MRRLLSAIVLAMATSPLRAQSADSALRQLVVGAPVTFPSDEGSSHPFKLRRISGMAVFETGGAAIVDNSQHRLFRLNRLGVIEASSLLSPDSARAPVYAIAIAAGTDGTVFVLDQGMKKVHVYTGAKGSLRERNSFSVGPFGIDMCAVGTSVWVLGYNDGKLIHQYDQDGHHVRSFASAPGPTEAARSASLIGGAHLACSTDGSTVALTTNVSPDVRAFDTRGNVKWTFSVPKFRRASVRVLPDGSVNVSKNGNMVDVTFSVFPVGRDLLAVQVSRGDEPDPRTGRDYQVETILIRLSDGLEAGSQRTIPDLKQANGGRAASMGRGATLLIYPLSIAGGGR